MIHWNFLSKCPYRNVILARFLTTTEGVRACRLPGTSILEDPRHHQADASQATHSVVSRWQLTEDRPAPESVRHAPVRPCAVRAALQSPKSLCTTQLNPGLDLDLTVLRRHETGKRPHDNRVNTFVKVSFSTWRLPGTQEVLWLTGSFSFTLQALICPGPQPGRYYN